MTISPPPKRLIYETIERLAAEQLWQLWNFLERLAGAEEEMVPLYQVHHDAIATGISDLAHQHDHYLYGQEKHNG